MKKLSYLFIALFISACQAEPDFTEEVTPLLHTRAGSLQFAQTDNLNLDALGIVHPTKIVRKDSLYVILTPQSAYRFAIYNHLNGTLHHLVPAGSGEGEGHCYLNLHLNGNIVSALDFSTGRLVEIDLNHCTEADYRPVFTSLTAHGKTPLGAVRPVTGLFPPEFTPQAVIAAQTRRKTKIFTALLTRNAPCRPYPTA